MNFSLLESAVLPDDFFDESFDKMVSYERKVMRLEDVENVSLKPPSSLAYNDGTSEFITMGYKYPQEPFYKIINDMTPTKVVFEWVEKYFNGNRKDFPIVPNFKPIIPPSRYEKVQELTLIDEYFIERGFRILYPTSGQLINYPSYCDKELPSLWCLIFKTLEARSDKMKDLSCFTDIVLTKIFDSVCLVRGINKRQLSSYNSKLSRYGYLLQEPPYDYPIKSVLWLRTPDSVELSRAQQDLNYLLKINLSLQDLELGLWYIVVSGVKDTDLEGELKDVEKQKQFKTSQKYYTRYFNKVKEEDMSRAMILGFDFNPYSPYAIDSIKEVTFKDSVVSYVMEHRGEIQYGSFLLDAKRYHSDVWYPNILRTASYNRFLMSHDIVVTSYKLESYIVKDKVPFSMIGDPIIVDPYDALDKYKEKFVTLSGKKYNVRSPLRYRTDYNFRNSYVPYNTSPIRLLNDDGGEIYVKPVDHANIQEIDGTFRAVLPADFIRDTTSLSYNKTMEGFEKWEYDFYMDQYKRFFVLRLYESVVSGKLIYRVKSDDYFGAVKTSLVSKGPLSRSRIIMFEKCEENDHKAVPVCQVPYCINRYPHNNWSTIVSGLFTLTLEQFVLQYHDIRKKLIDPPWIYVLPSKNKAPLGSYKEMDDWESFFK